MASTPVEDDTLEKIHSYVKDMDINGTYVDMTEQLLMFRPENPIRFMIDYLSYKHKETVSLNLTNLTLTANSCRNHNLYQYCIGMSQYSDAVFCIHLTLVYTIYTRAGYWTIKKNVSVDHEKKKI